MSAPDNRESWLDKADNDLLNIENNLDAARVPWDTVCFHAQQVVEKVLKAFLVANGQVPPRTHDLLALLGACQQFDAYLASQEVDCRQLSAFAVATRYPDDLFEPTEADGRAMVDAMRRVRTEVLSHMPAPAVPRTSTSDE